MPDVNALTNKRNNGNSFVQRRQQTFTQSPTSYHLETQQELQTSQDFLMTAEFSLRQEEEQLCCWERNLKSEVKLLRCLSEEALQTNSG